jgi:hypothetical protein
MGLGINERLQTSQILLPDDSARPAGPLESKTQLARAKFNRVS